MKYIWAAYKKGALKDISPDFKDPDYTPEELAHIYDLYLGVNGLSSFTGYAESEEGVRPVGLFVFWARGPILQVNEFVWFPWATSRMKFEVGLKFFDQARRTEHPETGRNYMVLEFARDGDKKYFEKMMNLGVLKRCGGIDGLYPEDKCILYYTKEV